MHRPATGTGNHLSNDNEFVVHHSKFRLKLNPKFPRFASMITPTTAPPRGGSAHRLLFRQSEPASATPASLPAQRVPFVVAIPLLVRYSTFLQ